MNIVIQFIIICIISMLANIGLCFKIIDIVEQNPDGFIARCWRTGAMGYVTWVIIFTTCLAGNIILF